jgi:FKBP-type peptidyl-prolyl cis-trans isomerase
MKALVCPLLALTLVLALTGCGPGETATPPAAEKSPAELQREKFFGAAVAADPAVEWRASGLGVKILAPGEGAPPRVSDRIRLHYTGSLLDGTVFDDTRATGKPAEFAVNRMVPGLVAGITSLKPGGRAVFYIPPSLGYGGMKVGKIPPVSGLIFDVELIAILPAQP